MSDIVLNTKRFTNGTDFEGASNSDLLRIAAQVLVYAGEVAPSDVGESNDTTTANILRTLRGDNEDDLSEPCDSHFRFNYCGETWMVMDEDFYQEYRQGTIDNMFEQIEDEVEQAVINLGALGSYVTIDKEMLIRDMDYMGEIEMSMAQYDGVMHELYFAEYKENDNFGLVTRRCTVYAYRED